MNTFPQTTEDKLKEILSLCERIDGALRGYNWVEASAAAGQILGLTQGVSPAEVEVPILIQLLTAATSLIMNLTACEQHGFVTDSDITVSRLKMSQLCREEIVKGVELALP